MEHIPLRVGKTLYAIVGGLSESLDRNKRLHRKRHQEKKGV